MLDGQLINGHLAKHLYKHILGWPIQFKDLESVDGEYYNSLKQMQTMVASGMDLSDLGVDFTIT